MGPSEVGQGWHQLEINQIGTKTVVDADNFSCKYPFGKISEIFPTTTPLDQILDALVARNRPQWADLSIV